MTVKPPKNATDNYRERPNDKLGSKPTTTIWLLRNRKNVLIGRNSSKNPAAAMYPPTHTQQTRSKKPWKYP